MRHLALALLLLTVLVPSTAARAQEAEPPPPVRSDLQIPDDVWDRVLSAVGRDDGRIGYTPDEMGNFGRHTHRLDRIVRMFGDVRTLPRESGRVTDALLRDAANPSALVLGAYRLTDISAGRMLELPEVDESTAFPAPDVPEVWERLPASAQRLVVRLYRGLEHARPWIDLAYDREFLERTRGDEPWTPARLHRLASAPWVDEENDQSATFEKNAFVAIARTDRAYLAYASVILLQHVHRALAAYEEESRDEEIPGDFPGFTATTALGTVVVTGAGDDSVSLPGHALVVDLGGNDHWGGRTGASAGPDLPLALHVDVAGDDVYAGDGDAAVACGLFGIGAIIDVAGDDRYEVERSGLGCAWHGTGLLLDRGGNDVYRTRDTWGQGAAHVGVGALVDLAGDDDYECGSQSQGLGSTLGTGLLLDVAGNDRYVARDDGNVSALYENQSVAMSQGCGYGHRADLGDGHSLGGGFGLLVDGAGDDLYHAQVWAQGAGYWWGVGILEDRSGNDVYENGKYSAGAGAHFAIGICVDLQGDDRHNQGVDSTVNQFQGHARDGSIGVFVDGGGDDAYLLRNHCGGSADLCSVGLFWDRAGDDSYRYVPSQVGKANGWADTGPLGTATRYSPFHSFRDDLPAWGVFLDTGGTDTYVAAGTAEGVEFLARDGTNWTHHAGPLSWGVGVDVDVP